MHGLLQAAEASHEQEIALQRAKHLKLKSDATEELALADETHQVKLGQLRATHEAQLQVTP